MSEEQTEIEIQRDPIEIQKLTDKLKARAADSFLEGDIYTALDYVQASLKMDPRNHVLRFNESQLYYHMDCMYACLQSLRKCLVLLPSYEPAIELIKNVERRISQRYASRVYQ